MKLVNLTKSFIDSMPAAGDFSNAEVLEFADEKLRGFVLRVTRAGVKSYLVRARIKGGKNISYTIGKHGAPWTHTTARDRADEVIHLMKLGIDPREEIRQLQAAAEAERHQQQVVERKSSLTLRKVFDEFCANKQVCKDSTKGVYTSSLNKHVSDWLDLPMAEITPQMVLSRYSVIASESESAATNTFRAVRMLFNIALADQEDLPEAEQSLKKNPAAILSRKKAWIVPEPRSIFIEPKYLPAWLAEVEALDNSSYKDFFKLLLVTGLRKQEALSLKWTDLDFEKRVFTVQDTKNGSSHTLPMTAYTEALFASREQAGQFVFNGQFVSKATNVGHWAEVVSKNCGVKFTPHALRRTFANYCQDAGLSDSQIKMLLNHSNKNDVTSHHYLTKNAERMREPLEKVEKYILSAARPTIAV